MVKQNINNSTRKNNTPYSDNTVSKRDKFYYPRNRPRRYGNSYIPAHSYGNSYVPSHRYGSYPNSSYRKPFKRNKPSRPPSPFLESEQHLKLKVKETSALIMRQLLSPDENIISKAFSRKDAGNEPSKDQEEGPSEVTSNKKVHTNKKCKRKLVSHTAEEIHDKIMHHLSNLNDGRKRNIINADMSGYDEAIQQIVKQKRVEISRALRDMCSEDVGNVKDSTDFINSIIPDIGIKIEDLPQELLEELQSTFDFEIDTDGANYSERDSFSESHASPVSEVPLDFKECKDSEKVVENSFTPESVLNEDNPDPENTSGSKLAISKDSDLDAKDSTLVSDSPVSFKTEPLTQTTTEISNVSTQTDDDIITVELFLQRNFPEPPRDLSEAVRRMLETDRIISELVKYRQNIFTQFMPTGEKSSSEPAKEQSDEAKNLEMVTRKEVETGSYTQVERRHLGDVQDSGGSSSENEPMDMERNILEFPDVREKILVLKVVKDQLLAATESGKIFFCSLKDGRSTYILEATKVPITCLHWTMENEGKIYIYLGCLENSLKMFNFLSQCFMKDVSLSDSVHCMDENWGYIFLGCLLGTIIRYSIKKRAVEYEDNYTRNNIFALKATQEGARRVLLICCPNSPVVIRDAMSGLRLRTLEIFESPTVYSLLIQKNFVYCGTANHNILVIDFHNGKLIQTLKAGSCKGISCMKVMGKLLFTSYHNGNIYVFDMASNLFIDSIRGPGGSIVSMEVLENQVVVGTMSFKLMSIPIPQHILKCMY